MSWLLKKMNKKRSSRKDVDLAYGDDRERILSLVHFMGDEVCQALANALTALKDGDVELAQKVIDRDDVIDATETDLNRECLSYIAMRNPVREELRFVFAVIKIATDLERIGDQAVNVAERAITVSNFPMPKPLVDISRMTEISISMVSRSMETLFEGDTDSAIQVFKDDKQLDNMASGLSEELLTMMSQMGGDRNGIVVATELLLTGRHLERVGDHASNIAERVFFMVRGERLRDFVFGVKQEGEMDVLMGKRQGTKSDTKK